MMHGSRLHFICTTALLALALFAVPAAQAAESPSHPFIGELSGNEGAGRTPAGAFEDACAVALDSHGDTYVSDYYHDAVDVFASGTYLTQIASVSLGNGPCALAVDSAGNVYVNDWRQDVVKFAPSSYPPTSTTTYGPPTVIDESGTATGVAIDPAGGNVYVDDGTYIAEYEPSGHPVEVGGEPVHIDLGPLAEGYGLAVSAFPATAGDLYVPDAASRTVRVFGPAGETLPAIDGAGTPQAGFAYLVDAAVAVDPTDGHVFVLDNIGHGLSEHPEAVADEFNAAGAYRGQIARWITHPPSEPGVIIQHSLIDAEPSGLAIAGGRVYVTSENSDASESGALDRNGKPLEGSVLYSFGPTAPANTLTIAKTGAGVGTVKSEPAGIDCGSACVAEYDLGAKVTLTASPDAHSSFAGWSSGACSGTGACKVTMSEARSLSAEFAAIPQQTLEVSPTGTGEGTVTSSPAGIHCSSGTCTKHFNEGSTVTLTATPAPHNRFLGWGGVDCDESTATICQVQMSAAKALSASFAPIPQQTLTVQTSGEGTLTSEPVGIDCGAGSCSEHFDEGATVTLTATPAIHNQVAWSGCSAVPNPSQCEVTMSAAKSVSAGFSPILHSLTVSVVGGGSVSASSGAVSGCSAGAGACSGTYAEGEALTLSATPAAGSSFAGFSGACGGTGPCHLTIGADTAVTANFAALPPAPIPARLTLDKLTVKGAGATLKLSVSSSGSVSAAGSYLRSASVSATGAGPLSLPLALNRAGEKALQGAKRHRLEIKATLTFTPSDGSGAVLVTRTVTFKAGQGRRSKSKYHSKHRRH